MSGGVGLSTGLQQGQGPGQGPPPAGGWMGQASSYYDANVSMAQSQSQQGGGGMGPPKQGGFMGPPSMGPGQGGPPMQGGFRDMMPEGGDGRSSMRVEETETQETGLVTRMSRGMGLGRAASPAAANIDWASKKVMGGVMAAGAMMGGALGLGASEEFEDHERWSEEAVEKDREVKQGIRRRGTADEFYSGSVEVPKRSSVGGRKRKSIAVVVSALDTRGMGDDLGDHAVSSQPIFASTVTNKAKSILAHLPDHIDPDTTRVFVLIYAPDLKTHPLSPVATRRPSQSMASSFSNISQTDAHTPAATPGEYPDGSGGPLSSVDPNPIDDTSALYKTLHNQAQAIVERDTMILPFTSQNGHKHILKSLAPETVYIQESLCGSQGEVIADLSGWVRQTVVVIGDEGGAGGLVDTDDESALGRKDEKWWMKEERTGLGKRVAVVESLKVGEDWRRRVNERD